MHAGAPKSVCLRGMLCYQAVNVSHALLDFGRLSLSGCPALAFCLVVDASIQHTPHLAHRRHRHYLRFTANDDLKRSTKVQVQELDIHVL